MAVQVCTGAELACSFGAAPSVFSASGENVTATAPAGVVTDIGPESIPPFGMCSAPDNPAVIAAEGPAPCQPLLTPWTPGAAGVTINGVTALDNESRCECAWAGFIMVSDPGQARVTTG
jgi:hypothetical protein